MSHGEPLRIGRFAVVGLLGEGGMGVVYRARDERLSRDVAIKVLRTDRARDPDAVLRFEREALVLSRMQHPGICGIYEVGEHEGHPFLVMQLVPGVPLDARIAAAAEGRAQVLGPANEAAPSAVSDRSLVPGAGEVLAIAEVFERIARALHEAHLRGLVHRDLKPSNLMVADDGSPCVLDFGLAREVEESTRMTQTAQSVGTPQYMAPEQVEPSRGEVGVATDVHALGVTLYEALTLWPAYVGATHHALSEAILRARPASLRRRNAAVGRDLEVIVETAMHKEPRQRYRDMLSLADDLRRARTRQPILARRPGVLRRLQLWAKRNPALATFVAMLAASLALASWALFDANRSRGGMSRTLQQFDRLAILHRLDQAESAAENLFPAWPERIVELREWIDRHGEPLALEEDRLSAAITELESASGDAAVAEFAELDPRSSEMLLLLLRQTLPKLRRFAREQEGSLADVKRRLAWAERGAKDSLSHPAWDEACRQAASMPVYGGLRLRPQIDLIPLGEDPRSGLLEFLHAPSHEGDATTLQRDAKGEVPVLESTGIVFVLIPGGEFLFGAQAKDPEAPNYDRDAEPDEAPVVVSLDPFFLAKHELTQAQWLRLERVSPSLYGPHIEPFVVRREDGSEATFARFHRMHPVEQVSWGQCVDAMRRQGLTLPTEAQWERACRAGSTSPWSTGKDMSSLRGSANLPDETARIFSDGSYCYYCPWVDGYPVTAPIGSFSPNAFGLHDMHGNVYEWCFDAQLDVVRYAALRAGDGLRLEAGAAEEERQNRAYRGGNFMRPPKEARSANRMRMHKDAAGDEVGLRPARRLF